MLTDKEKKIISELYKDLKKTDKCKTCGNTRHMACDDCEDFSNYKWRHEADLAKMGIEVNNI